MKRIAVILLCAFIAGTVLESCRSGEKCPAYSTTKKPKKQRYY
ncbi:hypothetical protein [Solitalea canadensis]|uniref:Uncharacterized protein n=1 Tax=Solitalea canadensis (strain ATCC 29591 / DSM 3403 / JCM 21819 / LMG 8368 / NBRC 15130 / NCIMB 12057 / USAM 9D) TaxID=929556 RepID=H8KMW5_SOLCM|nr:hypothetical protein [Solitalea canadensis]AFD09368.1 hypothetical protein Solca_4378 [Solitalea canadensis DSM 3403]